MTNDTMNNTDFIALDTETGGLDAAECALLSIAAVPSWDAPPFSIHILPVGRIDSKAAEVNGYTPEGWQKKRGGAAEGGDAGNAALAGRCAPGEAV